MFGVDKSGKVEGVDKARWVGKNRKSVSHPK